MMFELEPGGRIERRENRVMDSIRAVIQELPGTPPEVRMVRPSLFSFRTPVEVILFDSDLDRLQLSADRVVEQLYTVDGLTDVRSSLSDGYPEVRIDYDRTLLARFGLTTNQVAQQVRDKVLGTTATSLSRGDGRVDLTVRLNPDQRRGVSSLKRLNINP
jgi:HAE1 family hydrophobic/amphiphilic exporter-1